MSQRLGILASHPIQYNTPIFRELACQLDVHVHYAHRQTAEGQAAAGFGVGFDWDVDLLSGYNHEFLPNVATLPDVNRFFGCDTPAIWEKVRRGRFDAFLVTGWYLKTYWQAICACRRRKVPVLVRGDSRLGTARPLATTTAKAALYPSLMRQFDACLYVGRESRSYFERYGVPADRLYFSPHCVDNDRFALRAFELTRNQARRTLGLPEEDRIVLFAGKLVAQKRTVDIVWAAARLKARGFPIHLAIAGDGPMRVALESATRSQGISSTFMGFRNQNEMPCVYRAADTIVLPSDETWGLVVNEALASGIPAVVSDAAGCACDLVVAGKTGEVFERGNVAMLANKLQSVLTNPPEGNFIRQLVASYSPRNAALGIVDAVRNVCGVRRRAT